MTEPWHHLLIDAADLPPEFLLNEDRQLQRMIEAMVRSQRMEIVGAPIVTRYGPTPETTGWTLLALITASHVACYLNELPRTAFLDFCSCKPLDGMRLVEIFTRHTGCGRRSWSFLERFPPPPGRGLR